ncbi:MAG: YCF48-related protein [Proteobacteria bacterium]|nr:YCF48-related protein [Pseudomonadota bacterium]
MKQNEEAHVMNSKTNPDQPGATKPAAKFVKVGLSITPWLIIAGLLWVGLFIKPQPVGVTVQPPSIERTDSFYGIASPAKGVLWIAGNKGKIVRSEDDGNTWVLQKTPTQQHLQDIASWDAKRAVAVGNKGVVIVTADGGTTWSEVTVPLSKLTNKLLRVKTLPDGRAWAVGEMGALLESNDYGATWQRRRDEEDTAWNDVMFLDPLNGWVMGEAGRILKTMDGGKTWLPVASQVKISLMAAAFRDAVNGVAVGLEGSLLATHDGGKTWTLLPRAKRPAGGLSITTAGTPGKQRVLEEAGEHLFDVVWDEAQQIWFAVGNQGVWVRGNKEADSWDAGRVDARDMAWHTRVIVANGHTYLAGARVGEWNVQKNAWRAFTSK